MSKMLRMSEEDYASKKAKKHAPNPRPLEHDIQAAFFSWWWTYAKSAHYNPKLCFAIPNASALSGSGRVYKWKEGLTAGVSDVFLAIPKHPYHGLFLEFKRRGNKATDQQVLFAAAASAMDYKCVLVDEAMKAMLIAQAYLEGRAW